MRQVAGRRESRTYSTASHPRAWERSSRSAFELHLGILILVTGAHTA